MKRNLYTIKSVYEILLSLKKITNRNNNRFYSQSTIIIIFVNIIILTITLTIITFMHPAYGLVKSPQFSNQEISDPTKDWINMSSKQNDKKGEYSTDIEYVDYFSDGNSFNATLWLYFPFKEYPLKYNSINYGMLIDSDFDNNTGFGGQDYLYQIGWQNSTHSWIQKIEKLSPSGDNKTLQINKNYTGFFEKKRDYVVLPLNLSLLQYPQKYKVTFFAESKKQYNSSLLTDFTRTVAIPPLKINIKTIPAEIELRPGENKTIELIINSTDGFEPTMMLSASKIDRDIQTHIKFEKVRMPSYGISSIPLSIAASNNATVHPYTLFIFANSSFPQENLLEHFSVKKNQNISNQLLIPVSQYKSQNIITQSSFTINVKEPLSVLDRISAVWDKLGGSLLFFYGIIAGLAPFLYTKIKERNSKDKKD